ncbi:Hypothetical predicted protein [Paramuricea clavata]|uniref:Uncharacterized protein n=1 Tax=Paramuricea clavata TaxID=317549 RepID=A0A6S7FW31_PARCT|nr:Hypothetical predicted protein [Paramuricea clavata]
MSQAYQQLRLDEESKKYTTINTHKGLYQYNRLPFGISSAPGIFQRTLENSLQGIPSVIVRVDDILGGDVTYCGYGINENRIHPVVEKVEAITKAPEPENINQLRSFLGMLNYYHRFLPNMATILEPLHRLLRQGTKWEWGEQQKAAFDYAKELLQSADLLFHFDPTKPLILATDHPSNHGVGAVLSHVFPDGTEKPIPYASRSLNAAEKNYSTIEKEALTTIFGVEKFHKFLYGQSFTIKTDHKPLEGLLGYSATKKGSTTNSTMGPHTSSIRVQDTI